MDPTVYTWHWLAFGAFVLVMLVLDLTVFHRQSHEPTLRESAFWTVFWGLLALGFNAVIYVWRGPQHATDFLTGYLVEWSLSMDNVFIFAIIFNFFKVPLKYQYRVLFWGILGAIVMRLIFVLAGAAILHYADWMMWLFGLFLVYTGIRMATHEPNVDPEKNFFMRVARKVLPVTDKMEGNLFCIRCEGKLMFTPLFLVLLVVEGTDVLFAVDSVPAIFGITKDPFIVFTSNIFAILGLRALYFLLAGVMDMFRFLTYGLSAVLVFIGGKMVAEYWWPRVQWAMSDAALNGGYFAKDWWARYQSHVEKLRSLSLEELNKLEPHLVPGWLSLVVVIGLLAIAIIASLLFPGPKKVESNS